MEGKNIYYSPEELERAEQTATLPKVKLSKGLEPVKEESIKILGDKLNVEKKEPEK